MNVTVHHYVGALPLVEGPLGPCEDVVRVVVVAGWRTLVMQGMDVYWVHEPSGTLGMLNDGGPMGFVGMWRRWWRGHACARYVGASALAWRFTEDEHTQLSDTSIPAGAVVMRGVMLPDGDARAVGLI
jgi:hypothetical protein